MSIAMAPPVLVPAADVLSCTADNAVGYQVVVPETKVKQLSQPRHNGLAACKQTQGNQT